jgi:hypothetical protein
VFGVVPTENAAVAFTAERLTPLRSNIVAMVDGDAAGNGYVTMLTALAQPPSLIIQLPADWTIEDVVRWMLDPSGPAELATLAGALPGFAFASLDALRDLLKTSNNKNANIVGLKEDMLAHECVAGVLESTPACRARVVSFCEAFVSAATGANHQQIVADAARSTAATRVVRFAP